MHRETMIKKLSGKPFLPVSIKLRGDVLYYRGDAPRGVPRVKLTRSAYSSTRHFLFPVANFHFRLQFFCSQSMNCWN